jgi:hypothetical protein
MEAHFSQEGPEDPYEKYDGTQNFDDHNLDGEKKAMKVERLLTGGPKI